jgi:hypothetical protein
VILLAWPIAREGRRGISGVALFARSGACVGRARATWISIAPRN